MTTGERPAMARPSDEIHAGPATQPPGEDTVPLREEAIEAEAEQPNERGSQTTGECAPEPSPDAAVVAESRESTTPEGLFADAELSELRARWASVQAAFVDDPKDCVQKADTLVSDLIEQLTTGFAGARSRLEEQWARGEQASTEDLRRALMHYRGFFERLLEV